MRQYRGCGSRKVIDAVASLARARGLPRAQIALAWLLHQSAVTSPIIGASKPEQLDDAVAALDVELGDDEIRAARIVVHVPHAIVRLRVGRVAGLPATPRGTQQKHADASLEVPLLLT
jgi:aryl-alcohol dehydrogenase-like predicted oxidoreductase